MRPPRIASPLTRTLAFGLALCAGPAAPRAPAQAVARPHVTAELVSEYQTIAPGATWLVALRLVSDPEWHTYWRNPGDAGSPPALEWALPPGFRAGPILWPVPRRIEEPPLAVYGYEGEALFLTEVEAPRDLRPGRTVELRVRASWVVCRVDCIAEEADLTSRVGVVAGSGTRDPRWSAPLRTAFASLPRVMPEWRLSAAPTATGYTLRIAPPADWVRPMDSVLFLSAGGGVIRHAATQQSTAASGGYTLALTRSEYATAAATHLEGLLVSSSGWDSAGLVRAIDIIVPVAAVAAGASAAGAAAAGAAAASAAAAGSLEPGASLPIWLVFGLAFAGGILLNLMPCVFPVVSLKVLGFTALAAEGRRRAWQHGAAFAAGVLAAFWALAAVLLALRGAGRALGWGFQLQSPAFVAALALLMFAIGLNLLGVFEVGTSFPRLARVPLPAAPLMASFGTGVLATVLATPCTAPFMGVALGFGLTQPAPYALAVFTLLGLGMASPYAVLAAWPTLLARLPRPGEWMVTFKQAVAFPLFATTAWLVWVLAQQAGADAVLRMLIGLTLLAVAAWAIGRWNRLAASRRAYVLSRGLAAVCAVAAIVLAVPHARGGADLGPAHASRDGAPARGGTAWEPWSADRVAELRRAGRAVFVDFTAAWCLTCQVNERVALRARAVRERLRALDVATLKADWTSRDSAIATALAGFGRSSVPLYVLYPRDAGRPPALLPTLLTTRIVIEALESAK